MTTQLDLILVLHSAQGLRWTLSVSYGRSIAALEFCSVFISSDSPFSFSISPFNSSLFEVRIGDSFIQFPHSELEKFKAFLAEAQTAKDAA